MVEIIKKADEDATVKMKLVRPKDGNTMEEVTYLRDNKTGLPIVKTRDLDGYDGPAMLGVGERYADAPRWEEMRERKREAALATEAQLLDEAPNINQWLADSEEEDQYAKTDRASFTGLGGLLGPDGLFARRKREAAEKADYWSKERINDSTKGNPEAGS